jgi:hypothetical protein
MTSTGRRVGVIAAWAAAAVLALGAAAGAASVAFADPTPTPTPTPSGSASATPKDERPDGEKGDRRGLRGHGKFAERKGGPHLFGGRALHGEAVVKDEDGKFVTILSQRGEVTEVDGDSVTLKSEDGFTRTYTVNDDTRIRHNHDEAELSDVKVGENAAVVAEKSGDSATARKLIAHTD